MAIGDLITGDYEYEWAETLLIGGDTDIDIDEITGLDDLPDVAPADTPRDAAHGSDPGIDLARDRVITITGELIASSAAAFASALDSLRDGFLVSGSQPFAWQHEGESKRFVYAACRRRSIPTTLRRALRFPQWAVQLVAVDSYIYSATENTETTTRTVPGAGFTPPFTPPFTVPASTSGTVRCTNEGSVDAPWSARMDGPLTDPVIENRTTGDRLAFTANGGLDLAAGEYVTLDSSTRSVLLAGTASRRTQLSLDSRWWDLLVGENDIELTADAGTGTLSVSWRSTWM